MKKWTGPQIFRFELLSKSSPSHDTTNYGAKKSPYKLGIHYQDWGRAGDLAGEDYLIPQINFLSIANKQKYDSLEKGEEYIAKIDWDKAFFGDKHSIILEDLWRRDLLIDEDTSIELNKTDFSATHKVAGFRNPGEIWDYNALWGFYHEHYQHSTLKKYHQLLRKFQNYTNKNDSPCQTIKEKISKLGTFSEVLQSDWKDEKAEIIKSKRNNNEKELGKITELVDLLKQLFAKGESNNDNSSSDSTNIPSRPQGDDIQELRDWAIQLLENAINQEPEKYVMDMKSGGYLSDWKKRVNKAQDRTEIEIVKEQVSQRIAWKKKEENYGKRSKEENLFSQTPKSRVMTKWIVRTWKKLMNYLEQRNMKSKRSGLRS